MKEIKRGDIYYADLSPVVGSEQDGRRPVLIIQNDSGNRYSPTTIVAAITSQMHKRNLPTHVIINGSESMMKSMVMTEQIRTIDKTRLDRYITTLDSEIMHEVDLALMASLELQNREDNKNDRSE
ncbi:MAG: type II toxin-antitoxin system PemK/MazF family toxin [Clostridia bacterium]|nr:type II toxin-antitoxin system PemK/MazF family toxin [Clostridia bacterium]